MEFRREESFRQMCEDFAVCHDALSTWTTTKTDIGVERQREYQELLEVLRQEIEDWLDSADRLRSRGDTTEEEGSSCGDSNVSPPSLDTLSR